MQMQSDSGDESPASKVADSDDELEAPPTSLKAIIATRHKFAEDSEGEPDGSSDLDSDLSPILDAEAETEDLCQQCTCITRIGQCLALTLIVCLRFGDAEIGVAKTISARTSKDSTESQHAVKRSGSSANFGAGWSIVSATETASKVCLHQEDAVRLFQGLLTRWKKSFLTGSLLPSSSVTAADIRV